jgi:hypothetical protein
MTPTPCAKRSRQGALSSTSRRNPVGAGSIASCPSSSTAATPSSACSIALRTTAESLPDTIASPRTFPPQSASPQPPATGYGSEPCNTGTGLQTLASFNIANSAAPLAGLTDLNGALCGTTYAGGASNDDTLFSYALPGPTRCRSQQVKPSLASGFSVFYSRLIARGDRANAGRPGPHPHAAISASLSR